ncbi:MAG: zinc ribbon domain-containing protein [Candidatus Nanohaloarchaea archaeon]|nr:zinc ribbon domain-containing protein [Candidatus Nanohaloarchaea archaeon]
MVTDLQVLFAVELLILFLIVYDATTERDWLPDRQLFLILLLTVLVPVLGAVIYLATVYRHEQRLVECPECGARVDEAATTCPECGFDREETHEEPEEYECDVCGETFDTRRGLLSHRKRHSSEERASASSGTSEASAETTSVKTETYECDVCGDEFDSERGLHIHQSVKHD